MYSFFNFINKETEAQYAWVIVQGYSGLNMSVPGEQMLPLLFHLSVLPFPVSSVPGFHTELPSAAIRGDWFDLTSALRNLLFDVVKSPSGRQAVDTGLLFHLLAILLELSPQFAYFILKLTEWYFQPPSHHELIWRGGPAGSSSMLPWGGLGHIPCSPSSERGLESPWLV